jgi:hypothetical protein
MSNLFTLAYWFNLRPAPFGEHTKIIIAAVVVLLAALFTFLKIMKDKGYNNKMWLSVADFCIANIILACLLLFFSIELVPVFSAKFWLVIWLAEMIFWLVLIAKRVKRSKVRQVNEAKEQEIKKYLPK